MNTNVMKKKNLKMKLRTLLVMVLIICIALGASCTTALAASKVNFGDSAVTVDSFNGVPAYYKVGNHNSDATYSCAAYVKRYYSQVFGVNVSNLLTGRTPAVSNAGYSFKEVGQGQALPGDVGYQTNSRGGGHWFIIKTVSGNSMTIIEQNWKGSTTSTTINRVVTYGSTAGLKVFRLQKNGVDVNGGGNNGGNTGGGTVVVSTKDYSGTWAIMANGSYCVNVQFASKVSDGAKLVIDGYNGELNEVYQFTKYGNYYRISPLHAPNLAVNAQYGKDAKAGQQVSLHTWVNNDAASLWSIEEVSGGIRFRNKANTNLVIDVNQNWKSKVGNRINLWIQNNTSDQTFTLKAVNTNNNGGSNGDYSGRWAIMANGSYCVNVQFASKVSDGAKLVIDGYNGELNEVYQFTKYGNYYRISPLHAPNLAVNAQYGKDAKAGQQVSLHTWVNNDAASLWSIEEVSGGIRFRNKANPNLVIDVNQNWKSKVGNRINLWTQNNTAAQTFTLKRV